MKLISAFLIIVLAVLANRFNTDSQNQAKIEPATATKHSAVLPNPAIKQAGFSDLHIAQNNVSPRHREPEAPDENAVIHQRMVDWANDLVNDDIFSNKQTSPAQLTEALLGIYLDFSNDEEQRMDALSLAIKNAAASDHDFDYNILYDTLLYLDADENSYEVQKLIKLLVAS
ncbi:MAG: hypothetical protein MJK04_19490, partial [Psychrosphaera sp.]|nr:hypothetical protein [Psychrosphaera sp.]